MSNNNEEYKSPEAIEYHRQVTKITEQNAENAKQYNAWRDSPEPKPPFEMIGEIPINEQQIHEKAMEIAQRKTEEQQKLDQSGLSFEGKLRAKMGDEAVDQARSAAREAQLEKARKLGL